LLPTTNDVDASVILADFAIGGNAGMPMHVVAENL